MFLDQTVLAKITIDDPIAFMTDAKNRAFQILNTQWIEHCYGKYLVHAINRVHSVEPGPILFDTVSACNMEVRAEISTSYILVGELVYVQIREIIADTSANGTVYIKDPIDNDELFIGYAGLSVNANFKPKVNHKIPCVVTYAKSAGGQKGVYMHVIIYLPENEPEIFTIDDKIASSYVLDEYDYDACIKYLRDEHKGKTPALGIGAETPFKITPLKFASKNNSPKNAAVISQKFAELKQELSAVNQHRLKYWMQKYGTRKEYEYVARALNGGKASK